MQVMIRYDVTNLPGGSKGNVASSAASAWGTLIRSTRGTCIVCLLPRGAIDGDEDDDDDDDDDDDEEEEEEEKEEEEVCRSWSCGWF